MSLSRKYPEQPFILSIRTVYINLLGSANGYFPSRIIYGHGIKCRVVVMINRLNQVVRTAEDDQGIARYVHLYLLAGCFQV